MKLDQKVIGKLGELITEAEAVQNTARSYQHISGEYVDENAASRWSASCLSILGRFFGETSDYYRHFTDVHKRLESPSDVRQGKGILEAAKRDYEDGFIIDARKLIQAEVFDDLLDQARFLFESGYFQPAAVIAGAVLEDGLRRLCETSGIALAPKPKLDTMNADLSKQGIYSIMVQKKITYLADLRNKAAHGQWSEFTEKDVEGMLQDVRRLMEEHF